MLSSKSIHLAYHALEDYQRIVNLAEPIAEPLKTHYYNLLDAGIAQ